MSIKVERDGDSHALMLLDKQYRGLLTQQNYAKKQGYLVIEDACHNKPESLPAKLTCRNYRSPFPNPIVGRSYEITGNYVIDDWHGSWAEIHGLSELKQLD